MIDRVRVALAAPGRALPEGTQLAVFPGDEPAVIRGRDPADFLAGAAALAAAGRVFVVPGLYVRNGRLCLCLLDDRGRVAGEQAATHLNTEWAADLKRGTDIHLFDTPFGPLFLCVDVDVYHPEVLRIAALGGAAVVVAVQYIAPDVFREEMILAGAWQEAQQNCLFVADSTNAGGRLIGPCRVTADNSGYIARGDFPLAGEFVAADRERAYRRFPIFQSLNRPLCRRYAAYLQS